MTALHDQLMRRLRELGVEERAFPGRDDGFAALLCNGKEFAHFHHATELDIRLGRKTIEREGLVHPAGSKVHPKRSKNSPWIEVRIDDREDIDEVVRLVRLALEAL
jgi:Family of unknown function (DUF5519)